ncbi:MAG TPA: hypothetical protein VFL14_14225, partial [Xanthomonadales bacterium]|nr:hypothetical protein [Xanthomonadales bacterium]
MTAPSRGIRARVEILAQRIACGKPALERFGYIPAMEIALVIVICLAALVAFVRQLAPPDVVAVAVLVAIAVSGLVGTEAA